MGKVVYGFTASLDGFIAGPGHDMSWLEDAVAQLSKGSGNPAGDGSGVEPGDGSGAQPGGPAEPSREELASRGVGAMLSGRGGYDAALAQAEERGELTAQAYGGAWHGPEFVLTHRPEELADDPTVTALGGPVEAAIQTAREAAGDKDLMLVSADIARQALELGLVDELQMSQVPVFLGDGVRIFDVPGG